MAAATRHACQYPGCPALLSGIFRHCPRHAPKMNALAAENQAAREAEYRHQPTTKASKQFLNSIEWQRARVNHLGRSPFCAVCERDGITALAIDVHHIHPRRTHPHLALDEANLESLCKPCHSRITAKEN